MPTHKLDYVADYRRGLVQYDHCSPHGPYRTHTNSHEAGMTTDVGPLQMLFMRMRWSICPFPHINAYVDNGKAYVFIVGMNGEPQVLKDDYNLFPSDTLITQLRLLAG